MKLPNTDIQPLALCGEGVTWKLLLGNVSGAKQHEEDEEDWLYA